MQQNNGLDRNQLISFFVFSLILMGFMFYFSNKQAEEEQVRLEQQKIEQVQQQKNASTMATLNTNVPADISIINIENEKLKIAFSTKGGQVTKVELPQYKAYNPKTDNADLPLNLIDNSSVFGFQFKDKEGRIINTKDLVFLPKIQGNTVTMTANLNGTLLQFIYTLKDYTVDFQVKSQGLSHITADETVNFIWDYKVKNLEKGRSQEESHSEFSYAFNDYKDYDYDARTDMNEPEETLNWIGVKQQFFASVVEAKTGGFKQSKGFQEIIEEGEFLKKMTYDGRVQLNGGEFNQNFVWYFLPLELELLKSYDKNFDEILPLGWSFIGSMNRWFFIPMYNTIASWGISAGWVIFLMTIIVKLILSPIMFKQHKLSAMMRVIRPEIDEVNKKYKDADPMKKQQEVMNVYRKAGVNQLAGCLPGLLQIPIFYALFRFFPNFIELRGQSFWFVNDLTAYDDLIKIPNIPLLGDHLSIFAIACTAVVLIYTMMTSGNIQQPQQEGMPNMKVLMYIFPITFMFFLNSSASGLSWYYFVSNAINIIIILVIKYWILDEKKIHAQIQANKAQPKKEGKFQKRMREMMERAQEQQRMMEQQRNKKK